WIYYPAKGVLEGKRVKDEPAGIFWGAEASKCLENVLSSVPALLRPIAKKAVKKKAALLASSRALSAVTSVEVRDAFLSETPGPFQGPLKRCLKELGLING
ncbi:MAG: hypothetical protein ABSG42_02910, partial [Nitrospirota bacterium]